MDSISGGSTSRRDEDDAMSSGSDFASEGSTMPTTMHKILIHGPEIIDFMNVAIGLLGEDAQESRNKDIRNFREHFTRKFSRTTDTFQRLMVSSDPYITSLRKLTPQKGSILTTLDLSLLDEETEI